MIFTELRRASLDTNDGEDSNGVFSFFLLRGNNMEHSECDCCAICDTEMDFKGFEKAQTKKDICKMCIKKLKQDEVNVSTVKELLYYLGNTDSDTFIYILKKLEFKYCNYENDIDELLDNCVPRDAIQPRRRSQRDEGNVGNNIIRAENGANINIGTRFSIGDTRDRPDDIIRDGLGEISSTPRRPPVNFNDIGYINSDDDDDDN